MQKKSKFSVFTFMMLIILGLTFQPAISTYAACPDDISSYWKLDEQTPAAAGGTYADFIDDNDGTGNANPTATANGRVNGAQVFDRTTTGIDVPADRSFSWFSDESFSIEYWVKIDSGIPASTQIVMGREDTATSMQWWVGIENVTGTAAFSLTDINGDTAEISGTSNLADGGWHHVVAVRDGVSPGENRLYVDGGLKNTASIDYTAGFISETAALNIGWNDKSGSGRHFEGTLDEIALYNRALSAAEILQHFTNGNAGQDYCEGSGPPSPSDAPFPDDTISLWELNEATPAAAGGTYVDSFDGNDGTGNANPTATANGIVNGAQVFDGAATGIDVPADRSFSWFSDESFSIEYWVKIDSGIPLTTQIVMGREDTATSMQWWVGIENVTGTAAFSLTDINGDTAEISGTSNLADGGWHHVVAVRDGGSPGENRLYVDGGLKDTASINYTDGFGSETAALNIGWNDKSGSGRHFEGTLDEMALYDRALSLTEIQAHNTAGQAGNGVQSLRPPPDADAGPDQPNIKELTVVTLDGTGSVEGYAAAPITTYLWQETTGSGVTIDNADTATATFTAPDVAATLTFQLTVTADDGQSDVDSVDVGVVDRIPPVADAGPDQPNVTEGDTVTLDGTGSSDADGTITAYLWEEVTASGVTITNANTATASFTAPAAGAVLTFKLTVTDDDGQTDSDNMDVTVAAAGIIPVANAGPDQDVTVGDLVTLDGTGSTGTGLTYAWIQGPVGTRVQLAGADTATPTFTAPDASAVTAALLETLTFKLTVTDNANRTSTATTNVNVDDGRSSGGGGGGGGGGGCFINSMF